MPITVKAQGKTFTFPDGTSQEAIGQAVDEFFSQQPAQQPVQSQGLTAEQLNQLEAMQAQEAQFQQELRESMKLNPAHAALVGAGAGMAKVGQVLRVPGFREGQSLAPDSAANELLMEQNPVAGRVGKFVGETAATLPLGGVAGALGKGLAMKIAAPFGAKVAAVSGTLGQGAAEGAAVAAQLGEDVETGAAVGAAGNVLMPVVFRAGKSVFQKITGKTPVDEVFDQATGELTEAAAKELQDAGIPLETFAAQVQDEVRVNFDPEIDLAAQTRQAQLQEFAPDAIARPSRLAQDQAAQNAEEQLIALGTVEGRNIVAGEQALQEGLQAGAQTKLLGDLDVELISRFNTISDDANKGVLGDSAKAAINEIRGIEKSKVTELYRAARELAGDGQLVATNTIEGAYREAANDLAASDGVINAVGRALKEYNVFQEGGDLAESITTKLPREAKDLTLDNAELLRQRLNKIDPRDKSQDALFVGMIRQQLDDEVDGLIDAFPDGAAAAKKFKRAREAKKAYEQTFNDKDLVARLVNFKRGSDVDVIPAENILNTLLRSDERSVQKVKSLMIENSTAQSRKAWNEMKFVVIDDILRGAMNKDTGVISGSKFNTELMKVGDTRLKLLLGNDKFNQLKRFQQVLGDQTIPLKRLENPSGSSGPIIAMGAQLANLLKGSADAATGGFVSTASKAHAQRKAIEEALKDISTATGHSGRAKRLNAQRVIAEYFKDLAVMTTVSAAGEEQ